MPQTNFTAINTNIGECFLDRKVQFIIPRYQRPYQWTKSHIEEFIGDVFKSSERSFFIGSIILNVAEEDDRQIDIIDGQQRFLTTTIFSRVLLDLFHKYKGRNDSPSMFLDNLQYTDPLSALTVFRVQPGLSTESFFSSYIQEGKREHSDGTFTTLKGNTKKQISDANFEKDNHSLSKEEIRIISNYNIIKKSILSVLDELDTRPLKVEKLREINISLRELEIVKISVESEEIAYEIFETTNARGLDLSVADLLKNLFFRELNEGQEAEDAENNWGEMLSNVNDSGDEIKKFVRYFWLSRYAFLTYRPLFKGIKDKVSDIGYPTLLKQFRDDSKVYKELSVENTDSLKERIGLNTQNVNEIVQSLIFIRQMNVSQVNVLLMTILRNFNKVKFYDPLKVISAIENFTFYFNTICGERANKVERMYSKYAIALQNGCDKSSRGQREAEISRVFDNLLSELKRKLPSKNRFLEAFTNTVYANGKNNFKIKYILVKYNDYLAGAVSGETIVNFPSMTIEHILPRDSITHWNIPNEDSEPFKHKIGNLTVLLHTPNTRANNYRLKQKVTVNETEVEKGKISVYESGSSLEINTNLISHLENICGSDFDHTRWNEESIESRTKDIADICYAYIFVID
jgi:uncharacterized protein with ParB-like and HNH nuclease domain